MKNGITEGEDCNNYHNYNQEFLQDVLDKTKGLKFFIDSRKTVKNGVFLAIKSDSNDGNDYAKPLIANNQISFAIVNRDLFIEQNKNRQIIVDDTLKFIQALASYKREVMQSQGSKIIAITGSLGKTTVKEILKTIILSVTKHTNKQQKTTLYGNVYATLGNLNNHIGLPLTILNCPIDSQYLITELGINHRDEMELLASIVKPDYAIITKISAVHIENFKDIYEIAYEKSILFQHIITPSKQLDNCKD